MKSWEYEQMIQEEAQESGYKIGYQKGHILGANDATGKMSQLIIRLTEADRTEELLKAAQDDAYRTQLFQEFELL